MWSIKDKVCIITGATSGIGMATAIELANRGAKIVFTHRNASKANETIKTISAQAQHQPDAFYCDLSSFKSIRDFVEQLQTRYDKIDVLLNNCGIWETKWKASADGIEMNFAVNHLAPFLMTNLLLEAYKNNPPSRIITVSSAIHKNAEIYFDDIELKKNFSGYKAYAQSKLANILFTKSLAHRLKGTGITANCLHPGVVSTNIFKNMNRALIAMFRLFTVSPEKGAETSVYLASSDEVSDISGCYFVKKKVSPSSPLSNDMNVAEKLWELSEKYTNFKKS